MSWHGTTALASRVHVAEQVWPLIDGHLPRGLSLCHRALVEIERVPEDRHPLELDAGDTRPLCRECIAVAARRARGRAVTTA